MIVCIFVPGIPSRRTLQRMKVPTSSSNRKDTTKAGVSWTIVNLKEVAGIGCIDDPYSIYLYNKIFLIPMQ